MRGRERRWKGPAFAPSSTRRKRAVVEGGCGAERWIIAQAIEGAGFEVARCGGPIENGGPCPLVSGRGCAAVETADVVVNLLGLGSSGGEEVIRAVRAAAPSAGIVVQATPRDRERLSGRLDDYGCAVVSPRASVETIASTVVRAASNAESLHPTGPG